MDHLDHLRRDGSVVPKLMNRSFRKLPGGGARFLKYSRWYLGTDHLMILERLGYTDRYRRVDYGDIEALVLQKTAGRFLHALISSLIFAGTLLLALQFSGGILLALLPFPIVTFIWGLRQFNQGTAYRLWVRSPVQKLLVGRIRQDQLQEVLRLLNPLIEEAQGTLTADLEEAHAGIPASTVPPIAAEPKTPKPTSKVYGGRALRVLAVLMAVGIILDLLLWRSSTPFSLSLLAAVGLAKLGELSATIAALVSQKGSSFPAALKQWTGVALALQILLGFSNSIVMSFESMIRSLETATPASLTSLTSFGYLSGIDALLSIVLLVIWFPLEIKRRRVQG